MKEIKGTVKKKDLEGGIWVLEAKGGETFQLKGGPVDLYQDGVKVSLKGNIKKDILGIGMAGPIFEVKEVH